MRATRASLFLPDRREVTRLSDDVREIAHSISSPDDLDPLYEQIGDARYVLLGEASHGTSEFYTWRARITQRLIREMNFAFVAVEGDWPDCYSLNRYIKGYPDSGNTAFEVLDDFTRWPAWMWANWEMVALVEWLRTHNEGQFPEEQVGFYGLDVYSLWDSMRAIISYLQGVDPSAAHTARRAFRCFEPYGEDVDEYAWATTLVPTSCENEVVSLLKELRSKVHTYPDEGEDALSAEQNALVAVNAERYYRAMIRGGPAAWNVRDSHMADTLDRLMKFHGPASRGIVWAHNTHIGDARATDMIEEGEINVGQLVREKHSDDGVVLVGFSSHHGTVMAANAWEADLRAVPLIPAAEGSWEDVLYRAGEEDKLLITADTPESEEFLKLRGHRAVGVVYDPDHERFGNYVPTVLPRRYDALIYLRETQALHPLRTAPGEKREAPATYPWGV